MLAVLHEPARQQSPVLDVIGKGGGSPLGRELLSEMSQRMGFDFSGVRIHTGAKAAESAAAVQAKAYTVGNEVVFGEGAYSPSTSQGRHTIAHELTHVVQQSKGPVSATDTGLGVAVSHPSDSYEQEAEANAARVMAASPAGYEAGNSAVPGVLQRALQREDVNPANDGSTAPQLNGDELRSPRFKGDLQLDACFHDRARLKVGDSGPAVVKIQQALIDLGYDLGPAGADGRYGPMTASAIKKFKVKENLGSTEFGDVGPGTMHRLDQIFPEDTRSGGPQLNFAFAGDEVETGGGGSGLVPFVEIKLGPPSALTLPPEEGDCPPLIASPALVAGDAAAAPSAGAPPAGPGGTDPCLLAPAPAGALSDFEIDLKSNPNRIMGVVVDPDTDEIIGYRVRTDSTVLSVVDREGNFVAGNELGLTQPPIDPIDFIPSPGSVVKGATVVGKLGWKVFGKLVSKQAAPKGFAISAAAIPRLRGVSQALFGRAARAAAKKVPSIVRKVTLDGLNHSFDRHAAQFFGRPVTRATHFELWRQLIERATLSTQVFPWTLGASKTVAQLAQVEGKFFVVHFFEETGELASAFVPSSSQLRAMRQLIQLTK